MSVPRFIFIDTCIIENEGYRFESDKMSAFVAAAKAKSTILLLPDPTKREILKHIKRNAEDVVSALEEAKRKAPFLKKWKEWPIKKDIFMLTYELHRIARKEWEDFLANFTLITLDYTDIKMPEIMDWYDKQGPPFGPGKSKEFPDALSFAIVLQYARKNNCTVAIISRDKDFHNAAVRYPEVLAFESIAAFTQALIESDAHVKVVRDLLGKDISVIKEAISREFSSLAFYPGGDTVGDGTVEDVDVIGVSIKDSKVIALGDKQCTVAFEAIVEYSAYVDYETEVEAADGEAHWTVSLNREGNVVDEAFVSGIIKIHINQAWNGVDGVDLVSIDKDDIEVTSEPDDSDDSYEPDPSDYYENYSGPEDDEDY